MAGRLKDVISEHKKGIIIGVILWLIFTIVFVMPLAYGIFGANTYAEKLGGRFDIGLMGKMFMNKIADPFSAFGTTVSHGGFGTFLATEAGFTLLYIIVISIGLFKNNSKYEYKDIEHGSSDWSKGGSQYQILNKNEGIILAENNYLPVDKRGNVNVLVVGRIRFW